MRKVVLDIETKNALLGAGDRDLSKLEISLVGIYDSKTNSYSSYLENEFPELWPILEDADVVIGYNSDRFDIPIPMAISPATSERKRGSTSSRKSKRCAVDDSRSTTSRAAPSV